MSIFRGNIHNYGLHDYNFTKKNEKEEGQNVTVKNKLLTAEIFKQHLNGQKGLGLIPINEENKCCFTVIDVDLYDEDFSTYIEAIENNNFPLVPFKSKSGGLHIYIFFKNWINIRSGIDIINKFITLLGIDLLIKRKLNKVVEVFPKQYKLNIGDVGSWINIPYYNAKDTKQGLINKNKTLSLDRALLYIKEKRTTLNDANNFINDLPFHDAPPCLQTLYFLNPLRQNSGRNEFLFSFGVYFKQKDENFFEQKLFDINNSMINPIDKGELEKTILQSLRKKDYIYKCKVSPCLDYCNKNLCKRREYGVGKEGGYFSELVYGKMFQIKTNQPYYEWEVKIEEQDGDFKKLRFKNEEEIIRQDAFLKLCFRELHLLPAKMKQTAWFQLVNQYLKDVEEININREDDISPYALFKALLYDFLLNRAMAQNRDQILNKRVYLDKRRKVFLFRARDLIDYLFTNKSFRAYTLTEIYGLLRDMKVESIRIKTDLGKQIRVYAFPLESIDNEILENEKPFEIDFTDLEEKEF